MSTGRGSVTSPPGPGAPAAAPDPNSPAPGRRTGGRSALTVVAVILLLAGVGLLGWVAFQYFGTNVISKQAFEQEKTQLREVWQREGPASSRGEQPESFEGRKLPGEAIALLRIPAFGDDYEVPILEGVDLNDLDRGVGHYTTSAAAGQVGNFAIAGHRITHGEPFAKLLELNKGDQVVVETRDAVYTYVIDDPPRDLTVPDTATWVLDPVPGKPTAKPTEALLTMTTCQDLFRSPDRSVGFGHLVSTKAKG